MSWDATEVRKRGIRKKRWTPSAVSPEAKKQAKQKSAWDLASYRYGHACTTCKGARQNPGAPYVTKQFGEAKLCVACFHYPIQSLVPRDPFA